VANITLVHDVDIERRGDGSAPTAAEGDYMDAWMDENAPDDKHNSAAHKIGGNSSTKKVPAQRAHGVYLYDLNFYLPADAAIVSADWHIFIFDKDNITGMTFGIERCIRADWVEAEVTWNDYKSATAWTTAGGDTNTPTISFGTALFLNWNVKTVTSMVTDAWDNRNGICTFIFKRIDDFNTIGLGYVQHYTKDFRDFGGEGNHIPEPPHLRITYTLDSKTFEALIL